MKGQKLQNKMMTKKNNVMIKRGPPWHAKLQRIKQCLGFKDQEGMNTKNKLMIKKNKVRKGWIANNKVIIKF
jgi:hypothetical protein